jgi:hypothetical protein
MNWKQGISRIGLAAIILWEIGFTTWLIIALFYLKQASTGGFAVPSYEDARAMILFCITMMIAGIPAYLGLRWISRGFTAD